jgi:superfamily II DNA or RNA helicase
VANAARWALNQFGDDIQILITVSTVEHLVHLSKFLPDFTVCYANMSGADKDKYVRWKLIDPNAHPISARERAGIESAFEEGRLRRCIATATSGGVWSTGVDFPHLNVLIRADAQAAPILNTQIPGRVSRTAEGKNCGILIDFDDCFNDLLKRRAKRRLSSYRGKKWEIKDLFSRHVSAAPA